MAFLEACESFISHYKLPELMALVLTPSEMEPAAFGQWLDVVIRTGLPKAPKLRLVVLDDKGAPSLGELAEALPKQVVVVPAELDMAAAREEISQAAGNLDTPGGQYRDAFVKLTNALGKQDMGAAETQAQAALGVAAANGWHALAVPIHLAMGASLAGAGKLPGAGARYLAAENAALAGQQAGDAVCQKLRVQARMCQGTVLILASDWQPASALYDETLPLALALKGEVGMAVDCYRLSCFCLEQGGRPAAAWKKGLAGVDFAKAQEKGTLASTTLAYLGEGLSRLAKADRQLAPYWREVERDLVALLGPDWRPPPPPPPAGQGDKSKDKGGAPAAGGRA